MARFSPARADVIAEYARGLLDLFPRGRIVVGVDGIEHPQASPPAGRERFAADVAAALEGEGVPSVAVPLARWAAGEAPRDPEAFYDVDRFRSDVLAAYRAGEPVLLTSETPDGWAPGAFEPADRAVLVVSGPFLHLPATRPLLHSSAWLRLARAEARARDAERLGVAPDALDGWYAAVDASFRLVDARTRANTSFDLADPEHPRRVYDDAC